MYSALIHLKDVSIAGAAFQDVIAPNLSTIKYEKAQRIRTEAYLKENPGLINLKRGLEIQL